MRFIATCLLSLSFFSVVGQYNNDRWIIGFSPPTLVTFEDLIISKSTYNSPNLYAFGRGQSNISYLSEMPLSCNGYFLFNKHGELIENGDYLVPHKLVDAQSKFSQYSQQSIILPKSNNQYYIFVGSMSDGEFDTCQVAGGCVFDILTYSIADMDANSGNGKVISKTNYLLSNDSIKDALTACRHANGRDWWLIVPHSHKHAYNIFLVTQDSIQLSQIQNFDNPIIRPHRISQASFSLDGSLYSISQNNEPIMIIDQFDRCKGEFTPYRILNVPFDTIAQEYAGSGNCFSPDNRFLYISSTNYIYQYEISTGEFVLLTDSINWKSNVGIFYAVDGKMYIGNYDYTDSLMSYIRYPNKKGKACELCTNCFTTKNVNASSPPNMPNYSLGALKGSPCDTIGKSQSKTMLVYPNPASSYLHIYFPQAMNTNVELAFYDMLGQRVYSWQKVLNSKQEVVLSLPNISVGLYTLQAEVNGERYVAKVLIE